MMPKVFIGSSSEQLDVAEAIQCNLAPYIKCELWNQGKFPLSFFVLESFVKILNDCDFGIFVFVPDDKLNIRNEEFNAVRDNVLFELGLFIGHLGRDRCFLVIPQDHPDFRLPTDLWGITTATYDHESDNLSAALGPACTRIKEVIKHAQERTRNYPADRAFRIIHGLVDLLDSWKSADCPEAEWLIACDNYDRAGTMSGRFFAELMRRRGERLRLRLLVGVEPGQGKSARESLGVSGAAQVIALNVEGEPPTVPDAEAAAQMASDLERQVGDNRVEKQIHLQELIRLWQAAGRPDKVLRWKFFGLEIYNTLSLYEDALRYGEGLLSLAGEHAPDDEKLQWSILVKLLMCHIGLLDAQTSLALAEGVGMKFAERNAAWRAHLFYLIGIFYARFQKPRDLVKGEEYLDRAFEAIQQAGLAEDVYHFQSVFNRNGLAMIRSFQGRFEEAVELCRTGFARLNAHLSAEKHRLHRSVLLYNIAQVYAATGSVPEAVEYYSAAIEMDPNYSEYYNDRGNSLLQAGRLEEARADYLRAIELSPPYFEVFVNLGQCCRRMGAMEEAVEAYSRAIDINPELMLALLGRAKAHEELGHTEEAIADYTAALAKDPTQWEAVASCGVLRYEAGDLERSLADFDRAIELEPGQPDLYHNRATVLADLGRYVQAERDIGVALKLNPPEEDEQALRALLQTVRQAGESGKGLEPV